MNETDPISECDNCGEEVPASQTHDCEKCGATLCNRRALPRREEDVNMKTDATEPLAAVSGSPTVEELAALKAENERLKEIVVKCNRDWHRLKDFIIACNGPGEMIRFQEAAKKNNGKGVEMFLDYVNSLWNELAEAKSENQLSQPTELGLSHGPLR